MARALRGLPYYGGKSPSRALTKWIVSLLPNEGKHVYVEPFAGMLGVLLSREPAHFELVNDSNGDLINWWLCVRDKSPDMIRMTELTPWSREIYTRSHAALNDGSLTDPVQRAIAYQVVIVQSVMHCSGDSGWSRKLTTNRGSLGQVFPERIEALATRLKNVQIENTDAQDLLKKTLSRQDCVVYCDPPYEGSANTTPYGENQIHNKESLVEILSQQKGKVAISGYNGDYDVLGWNKYTHRLNAGGNPSIGNKHSGRDECLWTNY